MTEPTGNGAVQVVLGERLRAIRQLRRQTLKSVATAAGISESFLSQLERGRTNATIATLQRLSTALGIEVSDLFTSGPPRPRVLRRDAREFVAWGELGRKALLTPKPFHSLEVVVAALRAGRLDGRRAVYARRLRGAADRRRGSSARAARHRRARARGRRQRPLPELDTTPRLEPGRRDR